MSLYHITIEIDTVQVYNIISICAKAKQTAKYTYNIYIPSNTAVPTGSQLPCMAISMHAYASCQGYIVSSSPTAAQRWSRHRGGIGVHSASLVMCLLDTVTWVIEELMWLWAQYPTVGVSFLYVRDVTVVTRANGDQWCQIGPTLLASGPLPYIVVTATCSLMQTLGRSKVGWGNDILVVCIPG